MSGRWKISGVNSGTTFKQRQRRAYRVEPPLHISLERSCWIHSSSGLIGVDTLHIIDGQQRLTTLQFLLKAVELSLLEFDLATYAGIVASSLRNGNVETMRDAVIEIYKVWPTFRDRQHYESVLTATRKGELQARFPGSFIQRGTLRRIGVHHPPAFLATWYFSDRCSEWINGTGETERSVRGQILVESILQDLKLVSIVLDDRDDAQVIFETLNGRGATLHATDLIRNFVFMRADREGSDSKKLYDQYWSSFETNYWSQEQRRGRVTKPRIEWFIHATLQSQRKNEVDLGRIYHEYRRYVFGGETPKSAEAQLDLLSTYSTYYRELLDAEGASPIARFGQRTLPFDLTTTHALALFIAATQHDAHLQSRMFDILISYIVRRAICGLTQQNYNNVFLSILRNIGESAPSPAALFRSLSELKGEASRWPDDGEFENACATGDLYPRQGMEPAKVRMILGEIESQLRREIRGEDRFAPGDTGLDIDHILPQSWYQHWPLTDGSTVEFSDVQSARYKRLTGSPLDEREHAILERGDWVNTLGNITLLNLSVNREAQNKPFAIKKSLLIENTSLRLNVPLLTQHAWDEQSIKERGRKLAAVALRVWPKSA